jgi:HK97 gp10 family phage protein
MVKFGWEVDGLKALQKTIKRIGYVPQKCVTPAVKKAVRIVHKQAVQDAPKKTGNLKRGIIMVGEKAQAKGKKVYRIVFDRKMNEVFQKKNKEGKVTGYYPVSQEYGWYTQKGRYIEGKKFIRNALAENDDKMAEVMVTEIKKNIDKEIAKGGLR